MDALLIFITKYGATKKVIRTFKDMNHLNNYINLMCSKYDWNIDELYY